MMRGGQGELHAGEQAASLHPGYAASSRVGRGEQVDRGSSRAGCGACGRAVRASPAGGPGPRARTPATAARVGGSAWADNASSVGRIWPGGPAHTAPTTERPQDLLCGLFAGRPKHKILRLK
jgi:hypothetical protein